MPTHGRARPNAPHCQPVQKSSKLPKMTRALGTCLSTAKRRHLSPHRLRWRLTTQPSVRDSNVGAFSLCRCVCVCPCPDWLCLVTGKRFEFCYPSVSKEDFSNSISIDTHDIDRKKKRMYPSKTPDNSLEKYEGFVMKVPAVLEY